MELSNTYEVTFKLIYSNTPRPKLVTLKHNGESGEEVTNYLTHKILNKWERVIQVNPVSWVNLDDERDSYHEIYTYLIVFEIYYTNCKEPKKLKIKSKAANGTEAAQKLEAIIRDEWKNVLRFILIDWVNRDDWNDSLTTLKYNKQ